jgi:hypothetical protein
MPKLIQQRDNFSWLLGALIFLLFSNALSTQLGFQEGQRFVNITLMVTVVIAVWSVNDGGLWLNWKLGMSFIIVSLMIGDSVMEKNTLAIYQLASVFLFLSFTLYLCWKQVMFSGRVDRNKIIGSICIYILLAVIWAFAYLMVEMFVPGSFNGLKSGLWQENLEALVYYSFVTLTTLGYGDIAPIQPLARFMAYLEAITGIFYTTVLVASLIGMRLAHHSGPAHDKHPSENDK